MARIIDLFEKKLQKERQDLLRQIREWKEEQADDKNSSVLGYIQDYDFPDLVEIGFVTDFSIRLCMAWNMENYLKLQAMLQEKGWYIHQVEDRPQFKYRQYNFKHPDGFFLYVYLDANEEGTTCVIRKIGEQEVIVKKPVWEVICPEGAAEPVGIRESVPAVT